MNWQATGAACAIISVLFLIYRTLTQIRALVAAQNSRIMALETWRFEHTKSAESGFLDLKEIRASLQEIRERSGGRRK